MALYEFKVLDADNNPTGEVIEELFKASDVPDRIVSTCGRVAVRKQISVISKTASAWGDSHFGMHGRFDRGLGAVYHSWAERDRICKERGLIPESCIDDPTKIARQAIEAQEVADANIEKFERLKEKWGVDKIDQATDLKGYTEAYEKVWEEHLSMQTALGGDVPIEISSVTSEKTSVDTAKS